MRIRVNANNQFSSSNTRLRIVLSPKGRDAELLFAEEDFVWQSDDFTSASSAWLTGASRGSSAWSTQVALKNSDITSWISTVSSLNAIGGSTIVSADQVLVSLNVWYSTENATNQERLSPVLRALYGAEYVGD